MPLSQEMLSMRWAEYKFVTSGNVVVIKPNLGDRKPEYAANTHPLL